MAIVYRALDRRLNVERAIKRINPDLNKHERARARFISEARALARLSHPGIVQVFDVVVEPEDAYIVMELVEGGNLARWLADNGPMPPEQAVPIIAAVLEALQAAHDAGVVHRDIKPHNILLSNGASTAAKVRLTDFGIARMDEDDHNLTRTGVTMGTWAWMAPEQRADAKNVDARADIYGVGATFYSLLTGLTPRDLFAADQDPSIFEGIPANLVGLIRRATRYRREDRYPDAEAFLRDLQRADRRASSTIVPYPEPSEAAAATFGDEIAPAGPLSGGRSPLVALSPAAEIAPPAAAPPPLRQKPARPVNLTQRTVHAMSQWRPAQWVAAGAVLLVMCGLTGWAIAGWLGFPLEDDPQAAGLTGPLRLDPVVSPESAPDAGIDEGGFAPARMAGLGEGAGSLAPASGSERPEPLDLTTDRKLAPPAERLDHPLDPPPSEQRALVAPREVEDPAVEPPPVVAPPAEDPALNPQNNVDDDPPVVPVIGGSGDPPDPGLVDPQPEEPSPDEDIVPRIGQPVDSGTPAVTPPPTPEDPAADPVPSGEVSSPTAPPNPEDGTEL